MVPDSNLAPELLEAISISLFQPCLCGGYGTSGGSSSFCCASNISRCCSMPEAPAVWDICETMSSCFLTSMADFAAEMAASMPAARAPLAAAGHQPQRNIRKQCNSFSARQRPNLHRTRVDLMQAGMAAAEIAVVVPAAEAAEAVKAVAAARASELQRQRCSVRRQQGQQMAQMLSWRMLTPAWRRSRKQQRKQRRCRI